MDCSVRTFGFQDSPSLYKEGFSITLEKVERHHAGVYQCSASNGVGSPVSVDLRLDVLRKIATY